MAARPTVRALVEALAECQVCPAIYEGAGALGNAAQHYDKTRHPIDVTLTNRISYGTAGDLGAAREAAGQETMNV